MTMPSQFLNATHDPHGFTLPLTKVAVSAGSAVAVNADRIMAVGSESVSIWVTHPLLQLTWQNLAGFTATMVSVCILWDWWWKRFWRPFGERRGWLKPKPPRKVYTAEEWAHMAAQRDADD